MNGREDEAQAAKNRVHFPPPLGSNTITVGSDGQPISGAAPLNIVEEEAQQLEFVEGFPASSTGFALVSTSKLWTDKNLTHNQHVKGTFEGRVKGYRSVEDKDGGLVHTWIIEALDADLT